MWIDHFLQNRKYFCYMEGDKLFKNWYPTENIPTPDCVFYLINV